MKKLTYTLFAVAALMLVGGRSWTRSIVTINSHTGAVLQASDDEPTSSDPAGDPDGPNGPDGGPDGEGEGGPGAA
jgi:hypothetical protein